MEDYRELKPEDLVEDPAFRAWIYHGAGHDAWNEWINEHPDHAQAADLARNILLSVRGELDNIPAPEIKSRVAGILAASGAGMPGHRQLNDLAGGRMPGLWWRQIAAGLILAAGLGLLVYLGGRENAVQTTVLSTTPYETPDPAYLEVANHTRDQKLVNLPDGSSVLLMSASRIRFPKEFAGGKREVRLTGEAFFEIRKNPDHPFFVYAGEMVTRVVGTSFSIRAYENDAVFSVRVKTGKVSVSTGEPIDTGSAETRTAPDEIILEPNQQATLSRTDLKIARVDGGKPDAPPIPIETQDFDFKRTSVPDVFSVIGATYNVEIRYDSGLLKNCTITASLGDEPLLEKLNMICEVLGASYTINGEEIQVHASGCN